MSVGRSVCGRGVVIVMGDDLPSGMLMLSSRSL